MKKNNPNYLRPNLYDIKQFPKNFGKKHQQQQSRNNNQYQSLEEQEEHDNNNDQKYSQNYAKTPKYFSQGTKIKTNENRVNNRSNEPLIISDTIMPKNKNIFKLKKTIIIIVTTSQRKRIITQKLKIKKQVT